ncbi:(2Fe-2S) ferredoxin domain-containing protein [Enterovirga rhinocerotis]|uniref:(2Fe-2S) ferredoxin n=1 Tax=Enterovirga rhinocerotis TaxID=1339210 RepID=A0A4R7C4Q3_9HYPH|nr:(2Fe-2S) ferredoxin domain-containing protein [Enterovirga rhinocerotis]TDR93494.1 (2Fe-2S) ferredoxin [Enterovirga rhinocerotis]
MPDTVPTIVLYGRASFAAEQSLASIARRLAAETSEPPAIRWAFADLTGPSLPDVLDALETEGTREAVVVPCMVPADPSLSVWLAGALSQWRADRDASLAVRLAAPVEASLDLAAAVTASLAGPATDVALTKPSLGKPGWSKIPEHGRQLFFCVGARCLHRSAEPLWQHLRARMKTHRALAAGPKRVMCARVSCLYPCNLGPLMTVHPDGTWYGALDRTALDRIVDEHLLGDRPVTEHVVHVTASRTESDGA